MFNYASSTPTMVPTSATGPMNGTGRLSEFGNVGGYATLTPNTIAPNGQPLFVSPFCNAATCMPQATPYQNIAPLWNTVAPVQPGFGLNVNPFVTTPFTNVATPYGAYPTPYAGIPTPFVNPINTLPGVPFVHPMTVNPLGVIPTAPFANPAIPAVTPFGISPLTAAMFGTLPYAPIGLNGFAGTIPASPYINPMLAASLTGAVNPLATHATLPFGIQTPVPFSPFATLPTTLNPWTIQQSIPFGVNPVTPFGLGATIPSPIAGGLPFGVNPFAPVAPQVMGTTPWLNNIANPIYGHQVIPGVNGLIPGLTNPLAWSGIHPFVNPIVNPLAAMPWSNLATPYGISPIPSIFPTGIESIVPGLNRYGSFGVPSIFNATGLPSVLNGMGIPSYVGGMGLPAIPGVLPGMIQTPYAGIPGLNPLFGATCGAC